MSDLTRYRGDTNSVTATLTNADGTPYDLASCSATLTCADHENPADGHTPTYSIAGTISAPATGVIEFVYTDTEADFVGTYWYDIKLTDAASKIRTLVKGRLIYKQRIWT
jgi:hypothetical protein